MLNDNYCASDCLENYGRAGHFRLRSVVNVPLGPWLYIVIPGRGSGNIVAFMDPCSGSFADMTEELWMIEKQSFAVHQEHSNAFAFTVLNTTAVITLPGIRQNLLRSNCTLSVLVRSLPDLHIIMSNALAANHDSRNVKASRELAWIYYCNCKQSRKLTKSVMEIGTKLFLVFVKEIIDGRVV